MSTMKNLLAILAVNRFFLKCNFNVRDGGEHLQSPHAKAELECHVF